MLSHGSTLTHRKKFVTLAGGCAPEASTLPPVTVSRIFSNRRLPQFCSSQPRKLIFGMKHCFNPSRWNMKDYLNLFENGRLPQFFDSGRRPHYLENGRLPHFLWIEDGFNFFLLTTTSTRLIYYYVTAN